MRILVTGVSGFAGALLAPRLREEGHHVVGLSRNPGDVADGGRALVSELLEGDVFTGRGLSRALRDVEVAYYLIHSMETSRPPRTDAGGGHGGFAGGGARIPLSFPERERIAAENFAQAASLAGVRRVVYLGGPVASWCEPRAQGEASESRHLRSREAVERVLRGAIADTVVLRASIVIGARSRSFRFLVRLIERMPIIALPPWRRCRTRPLDGRDLAEMLRGAGMLAQAAGRSLDLGGPEIVSYGEMIERIAALMLVSRPTVGLAVNATSAVARVAAAIAREDPELTTPLMESLGGDLLPGGEHGDAHLRAARMLGVELHSFDAAVEHALREWEEVEPLAAR
ncbi:MAG TPA: NAD(P)H-binding protein [Solirubrobacteraceae bacterium]|nr:NAD(P)H-binding protein [Solirubrobacteraceae bacterium]